MTRILPIAALLLVAGCGQQDQSAAPVANDAAKELAAAASKPAVPSLKGEWRVVSVTGQPGGSLALTVSDGRATLSAGCVRRSFTYKQDRNLVAFAAAPGGSSNCGGATSAVQETAFGALGDANLAIFGTDGGDVTLSGPGGTLALERR